MPVINIEGKRVRVGDEFLSMTPDQQADAVDEIAQSIGVQAPLAAAPSDERPAGKHLSYEEGLAELAKEEQDSLSGKTGAFLTGAVGDLPIVGPGLLGLTQRGAAGIASAIDGESYEANLKQGQSATEAAQAENPNSRLAGTVTGNVGAMAGLGATGVGARMLGMTGPSLLGRAGMSAASSGLISGADTAVRGGDAEEAVGSAAIGGTIGGAIPLVGAGLRATLNAGARQIAPTINALRNPEGEASRRLGMALTRDATANPQSVMGAADEAVAAQNHIPVINADRGGETTRALARSVANQSPEARAVIENTASDRFGAQSQRATNFIRRLTGGNADDLGYQEAIRATARRANGPAYRAAYDAPAAQQVFTPRIQQLMQSPSFRRAVDRVPTKSADRGAVSGQRAIPNPFQTNSRGDYVLRRAADGTQVSPSLEFWDHVQRNLRTFGDKAARAGDNTTASELTALRTALNGELDTAVPAFGTARAGAAAFFGADDAVDAGRLFATQPKSVPEARRAFARFSPQERQAFATGYASELIDRIRSSGDRTNVINSVFGNQSARESMALVFGPQRANQIEAYVRVENLVDRLRGAMGNSTTARQLVELGIGAGGGYAASGGDWRGLVGGAALARGGRYISQRADAQVMERIAQLLTSNNPASLQLAVQQAARNPAYMRALDQLGNALAAPARSAGAMTAQ